MGYTFFIIKVSIYRYVLESEHMKKFFDYIQLPNFDIASDASATFKVNYYFHLWVLRYNINCLLHYSQYGSVVIWFKHYSLLKIIGEKFDTTKITKYDKCNQRCKIGERFTQLIWSWDYWLNKALSIRLHLYNYAHLSIHVILDKSSSFLSLHHHDCHHCHHPGLFAVNGIEHRSNPIIKNLLWDL